MPKAYCQNFLSNKRPTSIVVIVNNLIIVAVAVEVVLPVLKKNNWFYLYIVYYIRLQQVLYDVVTSDIINKYSIFIVTKKKHNMAKTSTVLITLAGILGPIVLVTLAISFSTDHWLEYKVDLDSNSPLYQRKDEIKYKRIIFSRNRGLFRQCYRGPHVYCK